MKKSPKQQELSILDSTKYDQPTFLETAPIPYLVKFNQHRGQPPKWKWLKRGYEFILKDPLFFSNPEKIVRNGMTKTMGEAIRFWLIAFKVGISDPEGGLMPTPFGVDLLSDDYGIDPYLENYETLWLLHWKLLNGTCCVPAWYWFFNDFYRQEFTKEDLLSGLKQWASKINNRVSDDSIARDLNSLLKMYVDDGETKSVEDQMDRPFQELQILKMYEDRFGNKSFMFNVVPGEDIYNKPQLTPKAITWAVLDWVAQQGLLISCSVQQLTYTAGSPGLAFKLNHYQVASAISNLNHPDIRIELGAEYQPLFYFGMQPRALCNELFKSMAL
jgi:hypothetical protein